jgi:transcriptional regulator with XRE-family HTH domain
MARQIGVSPTYLSMIERGEFPAPAEDKVTAIAKIIGRDRDELLALAGRVSSDLETKIMANPRLMARLVRQISEFLEWTKAHRDVSDLFVKLVELMGRSHPEELAELLKSPELADSVEKVSRLRVHLERPPKTRKPVRTSSSSRKLRAKADPSGL